jgi:hypothetical protein
MRDRPERIVSHSGNYGRAQDRRRNPFPHSPRGIPRAAARGSRPARHYSFRGNPDPIAGAATSISHSETDFRSEWRSGLPSVMDAPSDHRGDLGRTPRTSGGDAESRVGTVRQPMPQSAVLRRHGALTDCHRGGDRVTAARGDCLETSLSHARAVRPHPLEARCSSMTRSP